MVELQARQQRAEVQNLEDTGFDLRAYFTENVQRRRKIAAVLCCAALPLLLLFLYAAAKNAQMTNHQQQQAWDQVFLDTQTMPWIQRSKTEKQYAAALRLAYEGETEQALSGAEQLREFAQAKELAWMLRRYHAAEQAKDPQQCYDQFDALGEFLDSPQRKQSVQPKVLDAGWAALRNQDYWKAGELFASIPTQEAETGFALAEAGRTLLDAAAGGAESQKALTKTVKQLRAAEQQGYDVSAVCLCDFGVKAFLDGSWTAATGQTLQVDCAANTVALEPEPEGDAFLLKAQGLETEDGVLAATWNYRTVDEIEITVAGKTLVYFRDLPR